MSRLVLISVGGVLAQPPQGGRCGGIGAAGLSGLGSQSRAGERQQAADLEKREGLDQAGGL